MVPVMFVVQSLCDAACVSNSFYCNQEGGYSGLVVPVMFVVQSLCDAAYVSNSFYCNQEGGVQWSSGSCNVCCTESL